jgi:hypothetical protein
MEKSEAFLYDALVGFAVNGCSMFRASGNFCASRWRVRDEAARKRAPSFQDDAPKTATAPRISGPPLFCNLSGAGKMAK